NFDWRQFSEDEFHMCPPLFAVGGDGAMLDIGFQNLSRLMASGKPIRVIVLDTQVYSNTGGQACTSGFFGQVSDMAMFGKDQHGKEETRKELALLAMAHRNVFVLQSSQASSSHLLNGVLRGLQSHYPAVFLLHCPCPPEHGIADQSAVRAAKAALESRAFPVLLYDPAQGSSLAECLDLDGNPALDDPWPFYEMTYVDDDGTEQRMSVPFTTADWTATEGRFKKHFTKLPDDVPEDELIPFHEYLNLSREERESVTPFIYVYKEDRRLGRVRVSDEIASLAEDRQQLWNQLKQFAALDLADEARDSVTGAMETEFEAKFDALKKEYEQKIADLKASYPATVARRLAEGLIQAGNGSKTLDDLLAEVDSTPGLSLKAQPAAPEIDFSHAAGGNSTAEAVKAPPKEAVVAPATEAAAEEEDDELGMDPYIETARCTSCDECTNLNRKMFAYNDAKQAYIKDADAGTFRQLVQAAEKCPVAIIHPGTPRNPKEKDLDKWVKRAEAFS
ncbi:MAG: ferredoxin, partial [Gemmatimonadota bacterium]|nr:ferredoxin [Gemmatimonadota bacterium]